MDKRNTLEIRKNDIVLFTSKGARAGGKLQGNTVWFGQMPLRFRDEVAAEIVAARATLTDAVIRTVRGRDLYEAIADGVDVYDRHIEDDAYEAGKVLVSPAVTVAVVRFAKSDLL